RASSASGSIQRRESFGIQMPSGVDQSTVPADEDFSAPAAPGGPLAIRCYLIEVSGVDYDGVAINLYLALRKFQPYQLRSAIGERLGSGQDGRPVGPLV